MSLSNLRIALIAATALTACPALAQQRIPAPVPLVLTLAEVTLEDQFRNPPNSARPRVWWHWMNGNITQDGIAKDFAWMKRVGIGGMQNFDANLMTPKVVESSWRKPATTRMASITYWRGTKYSLCNSLPSNKASLK